MQIHDRNSSHSSASPKRNETKGKANKRVLRSRPQTRHSRESCQLCLLADARVRRRASEFQSTGIAYGELVLGAEQVSVGIKG
jgi:hypothetical protein